MKKAASTRIQPKYPMPWDEATRAALRKRLGESALAMVEEGGWGQDGDPRSYDSRMAENIYLARPLKDDQQTELWRHVMPHVSAALEVAQAPDNPQRLARLYLASLGQQVLWRYRGEWWTYRMTPRGACYVLISDESMRIGMIQFLEMQFYQDYQAGKGIRKDGQLNVRPATSALAKNVELAVMGKTGLPDALRTPGWISREMEKYGACLPVANGLLRVDRWLADPAAKDCLIGHTPDWFSPTCLPYNYDPAADCPRWKAFLARNLPRLQIPLDGGWTQDDPGDRRIEILQEFFGLCLTTDTTYQQFLMLFGDGANGKNVIIAALMAMLGTDNVSNVGLELFGESHALEPMVGKLLNVASDMSEIDKVAEGILKAIASGDPVTVNPKHKAIYSTRLFVRLLFATNTTPRFSDRSGGLWRRFITLPMLVTIPPKERVPGMDRPEWWLEQGEMPGLLNWALAGLKRLREQGRFSEAKVCQEAVAQARRDCLPVMTFLEDHYLADKENKTKVACIELYAKYVEWCKKHGHRNVLNERNVGKELFKLFPGAQKMRESSPNIEGLRTYYYLGIQPQ